MTMIFITMTFMIGISKMDIVVWGHAVGALVISLIVILNLEDNNYWMPPLWVAWFIFYILVCVISCMLT